MDTEEPVWMNIVRPLDKFVEMNNLMMVALSVTGKKCSFFMMT